MNKYKSILEHIQAYSNHLYLEEKSAATIEKYIRDVTAFIEWLGDNELCKEKVLAYKEYLAVQLILNYFYLTNTAKYGKLKIKRLQTAEVYYF